MNARMRSSFELSLGRDHAGSINACTAEMSRGKSLSWSLLMAWWPT